MLPIQTFDFRCPGCGRPVSIPIRPEWDNPVYVMEVMDRHRMLLKTLGDMQADLMDLAHECVEAGVRPKILQRADALKAMLDNWRESLGQ